jgi:hypothetical protein
MPARDHLPTNSGLDPQPAPKTIKDPAHWASGSEPMTPAQAARLEALSKEARELEAFNSKLTKAEASRRINALEAKLRLQDGPPHTL